MRSNAAEVLVVGAGPVGLALAAELARHGVGVRIVEARAAPLPFCRAIGVTPRTLEIYEDMGVARAMIEAGLWLTGTRTQMPGMPPHDAMTDLSDLPYAALGVPQGETERVLAAHLARFGGSVERGVRLVSFTQADGGVSVDLDGPRGAEVAQVRYLVGCDGAHSVVRHLLDIPFEGEAFPMPFMLGDVHLAWPEGAELPRGVALRALRLRGADEAPDMFIAIPLPERGRYRVSMLAPGDFAAPAGEDVVHGIQSERLGPALADIQATADRVMDAPPVVSDLRWSSQYRISMRLAARYRVGDVFIAGDAAHIHPPTGGQGMNTGIQDAYNLAWKLALVLKGVAGPAMLDSYEAERLPEAERVIARTVEESMALGRERRPPDRLAHTQIKVDYRGSPIIAPATEEAGLQPGDRAPDAAGLRRRGVGFPLRLFDLLRGTAHVLLRPVADAGDLAAIEAEAGLLAGLGLDLRVVAVAPAGADLDDPYGVTLVEDAAGSFAASYGGAAWLVRPDGYVAWRGAAADALGPALPRLLGHDA
ncbi:FAD-dependent monooxygenase [Aquabacter spiritensis]|uniref:2-polyprenyl-6-methoxyphenol hydroxylase-like FAD-dependent oxidoreductase n=1 Tax=Aquabacter spiritensis TaxID=933073 RepID=A0A4R3LS00_9HYPH|nr:FAD-dependent monooxygenase [Aquabacter spiritensis]TCT03282.1 2-polyprenyl-6-methoxyphenol hydroxylase-like FAD-dependent oxidoreductase [Aquabacter spiritensis]